MRLLRIGLALWLLACAGVAQAALTFPALTGRVVDTAQMIDPAVREQLTQQLQALHHAIIEAPDAFADIASQAARLCRKPTGSPLECGQCRA